MKLYPECKASSASQKREKSETANSPKQRGEDGVLWHQREHMQVGQSKSKATHMPETNETRTVEKTNKQTKQLTLGSCSPDNLPTLSRS